ncbi:MAG: cytochrome c [Candidatus Nitrohelix vancouverensis]|uniref:Cytochrome c n=1 Tax=Candidatus Nitrohelix vancouverensis TaxID=2705534 RepID=A0A7T0G3U9_9BACT|nr:MAG: cytochrome c [Candidatus Nitrohelix vancouverensis]
MRILNILSIVFIGTALAIIPGTAVSEDLKPIENCPQSRSTKTAPSDVLKKTSPLRNEPRNLRKGKVLAHVKAKPIACKHCHGMNGDGMGAMSPNMAPKPRNFTCESTMKKISDGQLYWIIKNGSEGTSMPPYKHFSDEKIWQLIQYIRSLAKQGS